jgi:hypothetical protein
MSEIAAIEAYLWYRGIWPESLISGVMFWNGTRIIYKQFMAAGYLESGQ